jgi:hypothetical protein
LREVDCQVHPRATSALHLVVALVLTGILDLGAQLIRDVPVTVIAPRALSRYDPPVGQRPTDTWREKVQKEATKLAEGSLSEQYAYASALWPESLILSTEAALVAFEADLGSLLASTDEDTFDIVRRVVLRLNQINDDHDGAGYETDEREALALYIGAALTEAGTDVVALAARRGITPSEITDEWRQW